VVFFTLLFKRSWRIAFFRYFNWAYSMTEHVCLLYAVTYGVA
jgi:hypothetical protein